MSKFNTYAQRIDSMAREVFAEYTEAKSAFDTAEKRHRDLPQRSGFVPADYAAKSARAYADFVETKKKLDDVKRSMAMKINEAENIGRELAAAVEHDCNVDPAQLDMAVLELLKSGILRPAEYTKLLQDAQQAGNITMQRLIAKHADAAAEEISEKYGVGDVAAKQLRGIAHAGNANNGRAQLDMFNTLFDVFRRTMNNPAMIPKWNELTAPIINQF